MSLLATYPPKPRVALSIGVIGHRPDRLPESGAKHVADEIERVLDLIVAKVVANHKEGRSREIFSDAAPSLRIVSALAEGADRMVARAGLERGMTARCRSAVHADRIRERFSERMRRRQSSTSFLARCARGPRAAGGSPGRGQSLRGGGADAARSIGHRHCRLGRLGVARTRRHAGACRRRGTLCNSGHSCRRKGCGGDPAQVGRPRQIPGQCRRPSGCATAGVRRRGGHETCRPVVAGADHASRGHRGEGGTESRRDRRRRDGAKRRHGSQQHGGARGPHSIPQ